MYETCRCGGIITKEARQLQDNELDLMCLQCYQWVSQERLRNSGDE